jgi:hypothetical protein
MSESLDNYFRNVIEGAGAVFVAVLDGSVLFRDGDGPVMRLYCSAVTRENVQLAIKNQREPQPQDFEPLLKSEAL